MKTPEDWVVGRVDKNKRVVRASQTKHEGYREKHGRYMVRRILWASSSGVLAIGEEFPVVVYVEAVFFFDLVSNF